MAKIPSRLPGKAAASSVTLGEVARAAAVSPMTVSNFVNGKFEQMSEETRLHVASVVERLRYRPNNSARGLRNDKRYSIGIIIVDESVRYLSDGFTNDVVAGLTNSLNEKGLTLQLEGRTFAQFQESSLIRDVRTDGLCVMLSGTADRRRDMLAALQKLNQPLVVLLEKFVAGRGDLCCVLQDDYRGAGMLARHLIEGGSRNILFLRHSLSQWGAVDERERGIRAAITDSIERVTLKVIGCGNGSIEEVRASLSAAIEQDGLPHAIMGASDRIGIAALKVLAGKEIAVPQQVKVTGFNASDVWQFAEMELTTVESKGFEIGQEAGRQIVHRLGTGAFQAKVVELPVRMIQGQST